MADTGTPANPPETPAATGTPRGKDEIALELMKFITVNTGYGKGNPSGAGFSGKPSVKSPEEQSEALLELFQRCRKAINQPV
jgi:hypothetical protein